jgi:hypothetical protein|tara:strand:- start:41804 stop:42034 length:231 start_codon:yes stop_codon:yes gene_type:complete
MQIRKISIGPDYKSGGMHYLVGQPVLNGRHVIHLIKYSTEDDAYQIFIEDKDEQEILLWKQFNGTMPISLEFNIQF